MNPPSPENYFPLEDKERTYEYFRKIPKTRCVFITIRDPRDRYTLNKAKDWIRKSCTAMTIVSSPKGGKHFHMLCALLPKVSWSPKCSKGIHFDIKYLNTKTTTSIPDANEIQESLKWKHVFETSRQEIMNRIDDSYPGCSIHFDVSHIISEYFRLRHDRAKRLEAKTSHETHVLRVLDYLEKNFNENDFTGIVPREYVHYYVKIP